MIDSPAPQPRRVLVLSHDWVDTSMAGPGIRYVELALVLRQEFEVILATPNDGQLSYPGITFHRYTAGDWASLAPRFDGVDVIFTSGFSLHAFPQIAALGIPTVVDIYDPFPLENLYLFAHAEREQREASYQHSRDVVRAMCAGGDYFVAAHRRQLDWWLGVLQAEGRVNPDTAAGDPTLTRLVGEVPFGMPGRPFEPAGRGPRESVPGLSPDDRLILWGGGLWDWLDPLTLVEAMVPVLAAEPRARLLFPGTRHPNSGMIEMRMRRRAMERAEELGLRDQTVFFGDWVNYDEWPAWLDESDVAVSLHFDTLETRFSAVRSRLLSYIWARVPMVVTEGDYGSELVGRYGLGEVVGYQDVQAVARAVLRVLERGKAPYAPCFEQISRQVTWEEAAQPLLAFCRAPYRAADRQRLSFEREKPSSPPAGTLLEQQQAEIQRLRGIIREYEEGRFIRAMRALHQFRQKGRNRQ